MKDGVFNRPDVHRSVAEGEREKKENALPQRQLAQNRRYANAKPAHKLALRLPIRRVVVTPRLLAVSRVSSDAQNNLKLMAREQYVESLRHRSVDDYMQAPHSYSGRFLDVQTSIVVVPSLPPSSFLPAPTNPAPEFEVSAPLTITSQCSSVSVLRQSASTAAYLVHHRRRL